MSTQNASASFTPGPWEWTTDHTGPEDDYGCRGRGPADPATYQSLGYYGNLELYGADGDPVLSAGAGEYCPVHGQTPEQKAANARLIAATPALYEALRHAEQWATNNAKRCVELGLGDMANRWDALAMPARAALSLVSPATPKGE